MRKLEFELDFAVLKKVETVQEYGMCVRNLVPRP